MPGFSVEIYVHFREEEEGRWCGFGYLLSLSILNEKETQIVYSINLILNIQ